MTRASSAVVRAFVVVGWLVLSTGCEPSDECVDRAVVTDIDETLTTTNAEWLAQFQDPTHDPEERPDASTLMQRYAELGYRVYYVTARAEELELPDGRSARAATEDWLEAHGFPVEEGCLYLADEVSLGGDETVEYKAAVMEALQAEGWGFEYAYGNADTDIAAFREAGIPDDRIFHVGWTAGEIAGVVPIPDDDAYTSHLADHLPSVPDAACD
jgi:phosphatidate phosphatase PAH1